jgi:hypothetical protein
MSYAPQNEPDGCGSSTAKGFAYFIIFIVGLAYLKSCSGSGEDLKWKLDPEDYPSRKRHRVEKVIDKDFQFVSKGVS